MELLHWLVTSSSSIPWHRPSTSAEWIRNSLLKHWLVRIWRLKNHAYLQYSDSKASDSNHNHKPTINTKEILVRPLLTSMSVIVCHLFIATYHPCAWRRQLRQWAGSSHKLCDPSYLTSTTRFSFPTRDDTSLSRSMEKLPSGKRYEVMMILPHGVGLSW